MLTNGFWSTHSPAESDWQHQASTRERSLLELRLA